MLEYHNYSYISDYHCVILVNQYNHIQNFVYSTHWTWDNRNSSIFHCQLPHGILLIFSFCKFSDQCHQHMSNFNPIIICSSIAKFPNYYYNHISCCQVVPIQLHFIYHIQCILLNNTNVAYPHHLHSYNQGTYISLQTLSFMHIYIICHNDKYISKFIHYFTFPII